MVDWREEVGFLGFGGLCVLQGDIQPRCHLRITNDGCVRGLQARYTVSQAVICDRSGPT